MTPSPLPRSWHEDWSGLRVAIVGLGAEGFSAADTLAEKGAITTVFTTLADSDRQTILGVLGVECVVAGDFDQLRAELLRAQADLVVLAKPAPAEAELARALREAGRTVWSLTELTVRLADKTHPPAAQVFIAGADDAWAIAGHAEEFLHAAQLRAFVCGGPFAPALDPLRMPDGLDVLLWCLSEDELGQMLLDSDSDSARTPEVSVAIGRGSVSGKSLAALYHHTTRACVYRRGDETEQAVEDAWVVEGARAIGIGLGSPGMSDLGVVEDIVCDRAFLDDRKNRALELTTLAELAEAGYQGPREVEIFLASAAIARCFGVSPEVIGGVLRGSGRV